MHLHRTGNTRADPAYHKILPHKGWPSCIGTPSGEAGMSDLNAESHLKDAHDHLKAGIAEMKGIGNEPPMSIYKAMHALTYALREANERVHYAEGTAALAMKHRDEAEAKLADARKALEPFSDAARSFTSAIGPDGIDDGVAVTVKMHGAQYEIVMSTEDFSRARATLTGEEGNQP